MRCHECEWLEIEGHLPKCGYVGQIIPQTVYAKNRTRVGPELRKNVSKFFPKKNFDRKGECKWALYTFVGVPIEAMDMDVETWREGEVVE